MIDFIIGIVKLLLGILPFVLFCLLNNKSNLKEDERSKQVLMPVFAVVFTLVVLPLLNRINSWLLTFINNIPKWISMLADVSWMPDSVGNVIQKIADAIKSFFLTVNFGFWIFFISNIVLIVVYLILKKIVLAVMKKAIKTEGKIHSKLSELFYEYFSEMSIWTLKENYYQVRGMFKVFYYSTLVISSLLMLISGFLYHYELIRSVFYPIFGIIIVGEIYFFLGGNTKGEQRESIYGENDDAHKIVNYSLLRKFLRSIFGDRLLSENTTVNNDSTDGLTVDDILSELEMSDDRLTENFAAYYSVLHKTGYPIDTNYMYSSLDLLKGKSILFNNPFYNDLIPYAFFPMNRMLLSHRKVLIVLGRHSVEDDIIKWLEDGIESITNIPYLWKIGVLSSERQDLDIGIITRSDVLDIKMHEVNSEFLENVGYCVVIEPSKLISTAQIGLNMIVKKCRGVDGDNEPVYCLCDKNCDGLVDAMSHILMTSITEVSATLKHKGTSSYMCWESDEEYLHHRLVPNISRYLGIGTELSFAALKNQVSVTKWYGGEAFPVTDMRWISQQYYYDLTKYANIPTTPEAMDERFVTSSNFWSAKTEKNCYITVEDEAFNMFEILRDFSTRTTDQGFINVISTEYLLKDYMAENAYIFEADPKAIPYIVADYTRSNRNTILRIILMMSTYPVPKDVIERELSLLGIAIFDLRKQLWYELYKCYSKTELLKELPDDYEAAVEAAAYKKIEIKGMEWSRSIINVSEEYNFRIADMETTYSVTDKSFLRACVTELRSAGYVAEDEKGERYYLGAELFGHIYQKYLPGQFFTFGGKYYEMQYLTADGQVLVRRAADHINGRPAYRQIRQYTVTGTKLSDKIGAQKNISGMKVVKEFADITVSTPGYYNMERYNDFANAQAVYFEGEKSGIPERTYRNKEILRIELPELDGRLSDSIRYTVTVLFNEIFKTIFAENQAYIIAVTDDRFITDENATKLLTYSITGENCELSQNAIYIIEDSQLDLGLTVAVERNLQRIFSIVQDYIDWHLEQVADSLVPPPEPEPPIVFNETAEDEGEKKKKRGFFGRMWDGIKGFFGGLFKKKKKKGKDDEEKPEGEIPTGDDIPAGEVPEGETPECEVPEGENTGDETPGDEMPEGDLPEGEPTDEQTPEGEIPLDEIPAEQIPEGDIPADAEPSDTVEPTGDVEAELAPDPVPEKPKKKGLFGWLAGLFKKKDKKEKKKKEKKKKGKNDAEDISEIPEVPVEEPVSEIPEEPSSDITDEIPADTDNTADEGGEDEGVAIGSAETAECPFNADIQLADNKADEEDDNVFAERKPYHARYYMLFGASSENPLMDLNGTLEYLSAMGLTKNPLKQARESKDIAEQIAATFKPGKPDARYCDFCGTEIYGVEYETLADGRDRCLSCGRTAIKSEREFKKIFNDVKRNMEAFFGIKINVGIKVEMVNSKTLHKRLGKAFIPTPEADGRVLGVAIKSKTGYSLYIENGSPRMASMLTMAHELTHIWQYVNWNDKAIRKQYGKNLQLEIYEGMAKWAEIQYAYLINEPGIAKREEIITCYRDDEYGRGFLRYRACYPFSLGTVITRPTPFINIETPLDPEYCGPVAFCPPDVMGGDGEGDDTTPDPTTPKKPIKGTIDRDPSKVRKYAYQLLNENEKAVYDRMLQAILNFESEISDLGTQITDKRAMTICDYVQRDNPDLFWFQNGATYYFDTTTKIVQSIKLVYCMTPDEAQKRSQEIKESIQPFMDSVLDTMSDFEVALKIYENIINLVDYDTIGLDRQKKFAPPSFEVPDDLRSIYGVFVNKKAVCAGYSKATQYLLNLCGIECTYVVSDTHAWNLIKLEGDYYHLDTTWGDGSDTKAEKHVDNHVRYDCFCITTEEVLRLESHTPTNEMPLPTCTATKCNYHRRFGLWFDSVDFDKIRNVICDCIEEEKLAVSLKFADSGVYNEAVKLLVDSGKFREIIQYSNLKSKVRVANTYKYATAEDKLTISFYLDRI